jgi:hypothetical protein
MIWLTWWILLIVQQASQTFISRARNGDNLRLHAMASVFSNGVWLTTQFLVFDQFSEIAKTRDWLRLAYTAAYYIAFCVIGSVSAHAFMMKIRGNREA